MKKITTVFLMVVLLLNLCACGQQTTEQRVKKIITSTVGDRVKFGTYYDEEIEWIVIRCIKNRAMLVTSDVVDMKLYHNTTETVTWENCDLRKWLNDSFYNEAFSKEEQQFITCKDVENPDSVRYETDGGNSTSDYVTLLSINEATSYYIDNSLDEIWWLRSPVSKMDYEWDGKTYTYYYGAVMDTKGKVQEGIYAADINTQTRCGVRPVIWLELQ